MYSRRAADRRAGRSPVTRAELKALQSAADGALVSPAATPTDSVEAPRAVASTCMAATTGKRRAKASAPLPEDLNPALLGALRKADAVPRQLPTFKARPAPATKRTSALPAPVGRQHPNSKTVKAAQRPAARLSTSPSSRSPPSTAAGTTKSGSTEKAKQGSAVKAADTKPVDAAWDHDLMNFGRDESFAPIQLTVRQM